MSNTKVFKLMQDTNNGGRQVIVLEDGLRREPVITGIHPSRYVNEGFKVRDDAFYSRNTYKNVVNVQTVFNNITSTLNTYNDLGDLSEEKYDEILQAFDRFIQEAIEYEEIADNVSSNALEIKQNRKKKVFRRKRGR
ncbi:hypothetical protein F400_gp016 [Bacillus phage BCD7]|uniref:Uncharacterized protein n=1 Tax=Bacillus phage BCD7 TaxID=1136534 RepID=J9PTX3_9CAUD|nr:hypothetical protein F400_gp016 [Bacillus phage BCD7]AEZ50463.1 hypothetical protein BCD7_0016 [Bacillus phage BCD7]